MVGLPYENDHSPQEPARGRGLDGWMRTTFSQAKGAGFDRAPFAFGLEGAF
jgi:hypothetical protein